MASSIPLAWLDDPIAPLDYAAGERALAHQGILTKPPGSLGRLEDLAVWLAERQGCERPQLNNPQILVFAADHGVAEEGVSTYPQSVTVEMIKNFISGGAAISVLARHQGAELVIIDTGTCASPLGIEGVVDATIAQGSANLAKAAAMSEAQLQQALNIGYEQLEERLGVADLLIPGEMGIANTTPATAVLCGLTGADPFKVTGAGTGLDAEGCRHKASVIAQAIALHKPDAHDPLSVLRCLGGFEIAAMTGLMIRAAQKGLPILVDGFICSAAALCAEKIVPGCRQWLFWAHRSAEPGHRLMLQESGANEPILDIGMRLGEASGAAMALGLFQQALALHNEMSTFIDAKVCPQNGLEH